MKMWLSEWAGPRRWTASRQTRLTDDTGGFLRVRALGIGWEAGPRQANGDEVIWAESLPIWNLPDATTDLDLRLENGCASPTDGPVATHVTQFPTSGWRRCQS
jgi:hypothetical protein